MHTFRPRSEAFQRPILLSCLIAAAGCSQTEDARSQPEREPPETTDSGAIADASRPADTSRPADAGRRTDASSAGLYPFPTYATLPPVTFTVSYPNIVAGEPGVTAT